MISRLRISALRSRAYVSRSENMTSIVSSNGPQFFVRTMLARLPRYAVPGGGGGLSWVGIFSFIIAIAISALSRKEAASAFSCFGLTPDNVPS